MKPLLLILIVFLFSISVACNAIEKMAIQFSFDQQIKTDSLRNPDHFYYLADLSLKKAGELILYDSIRSSDNFITFSLMDTISGCKESDLKFFLQVFEKILNDADGALAEAVGSYTWNFIKKRPVKFIDHIDKLNKRQILKWADYTSSEMYFAYSEEELKIKCQELINKLRKINTTKSVNIFEIELKNRIQKGL